MCYELEEANPRFIDWCKEHGVNLQNLEDWYPWIECWVDGYNTGVEDIKKVLRGD